MMDTGLRKISTSIIYNSIGSSVYLFCQWLITFIVVWVSGYEAAGILSIAMSISNTFGVIATFNMRNYQSSDVNKKFSEKTYITSRILTSSIALIVTLIYCLIEQFSLFQILCITAFMLFKISEALVDVLHGSIQRKWRFDIIGKSYFIRGILSVTLFFLGLYLTNNLFIALLFMSVGVYTFIFFYDLKNYKYEFPNMGTTKKHHIIKLLLQCIPLVVYGIVFNYVAMYPKVMSEELFGTTMLGYYASVSTPALIIQVAATFIFNPMISLFADYYNKKDFKKLNIAVFKVIMLIIIIGIIGLIASHFLASWVLNLLFGKQINSYVYLFNGVIIVSCLTAIIWFLGMILMVVRDYKALLFGSFFALIVSIIITPILLNRYNLNGINIDLIIVFLIQVLIYLFVIFRLKNKKVYDLNRIYYLRTTSIVNDSRATKEITSLINNNYNLFVLGWDRDNKIKDYNNIIINGNKINGKFFKFNAGYGESLINLLGLAFFQIWLFIRLIKDRKKYNCIHACDFDSGFTALIISKLCNKKLIYDMYDYYSDSRMMSSKIEKIVNKLENIVINNAETTIICGEWRKQQIEKAHPKKLSIIHNTPDIKSVEDRKIIKGKSQKVKLAYIGILQDHRLLLEIINEIKNNDNYELHIGGFGKYENEVNQVSKKFKNIYFYGSLSYSDVLCLEKDCDVLFATYDPNIKNHKYSAPNKVYEAMALGKPIIVCKGTGIDKLIIENKIGIAIEYNAIDFVNQLDKLCADKNKLKRISSISRDLYNEKFSWNIMEKELINIYKNINDKN